jgi:hypothetical protein
MIGTALHFADSQGEKAEREKMGSLVELSRSPPKASYPTHAYLTFNGCRKFSASRLLFSSAHGRTDATVTGKRDGN